jgi:hypothetical protein
MRFGIVAEGRADLAVITNVLKGAVRVDDQDIQWLVPEYRRDETDRHDPPKAGFSNWELVRTACVDGGGIAEFFDSPVADEKWVVIHVDAAEADLYGVERAAAGGEGDLVEELRRRIVAQIDQWLGDRFDERVRHAVAVQETDAWVLTLFTTDETASLANPKERLNRAMNDGFSDKERKRLFQRKAFPRYDELSKALRKPKQLEECCRRNRSLALFVGSLPRPDR